MKKMKFLIQNTKHTSPTKLYKNVIYGRYVFINVIHFLKFSVKLQRRFKINVTVPTKCGRRWPISELQGRKCCPQEKTYA